MTICPRFPRMGQMSNIFAIVRPLVPNQDWKIRSLFLHPPPPTFVDLYDIGFPSSSQHHQAVLSKAGVPKSHRVSESSGTFVNILVPVAPAPPL